jgi:transglutaminase superfamily protein/coenzyme PQQ synthesis protein D (PqqD)
MTRQKTTSACAALVSGEFPSRLSKYADGIVLLSVKDDLICKLNAVGALTWLTIEEEGESTVDQIVLGLRERIDDINREGKYRFEVSDHQLLEDTERFLGKMVEKRLLIASLSPTGCNHYQIPKGVSGTTKGTVSLASAPTTSQAQSTISSAPLHVETGKASRLATEVTSVQTEPLNRDIFVAFIGLTFFDLLLKTSGFESLVNKVKNWPLARHRVGDDLAIKRVKKAVDRAQMYYPKKAMCLQHSAVTTCLLRRSGVNAEMVLAAIDFPVKAHAWSEVDGKVVNDSQSVKSRYRELKRV